MLLMRSDWSINQHSRLCDRCDNCDSLSQNLLPTDYKTTFNFNDLPYIS